MLLALWAVLLQLFNTAVQCTEFMIKPCFKNSKGIENTLTVNWNTSHPAFWDIMSSWSRPLPLTYNLYLCHHPQEFMSNWLCTPSLEGMLNFERALGCLPVLLSNSVNLVLDSIKAVWHAQLSLHEDVALPLLSLCSTFRAPGLVHWTTFSLAAIVGREWASTSDWAQRSPF